MTGIHDIAGRREECSRTFFSSFFFPPRLPNLTGWVILSPSPSLLSFFCSFAQHIFVGHSLRNMPPPITVYTFRWGMFTKAFSHLPCLTSNKHLTYSPFPKSSLSLSLFFFFFFLSFLLLSSSFLSKHIFVGHSFDSKTCIHPLQYTFRWGMFTKAFSPSTLFDRLSDTHPFPSFLSLSVFFFFFFLFKHIFVGQLFRNMRPPFTIYLSLRNVHETFFPSYPIWPAEWYSPFPKSSLSLSLFFSPFSSFLSKHIFVGHLFRNMRPPFTIYLSLSFPLLCIIAVLQSITSLTTEATRQRLPKSYSFHLRLERATE